MRRQSRTVEKSTPNPVGKSTKERDPRERQRRGDGGERAPEAADCRPVSVASFNSTEDSVRLGAARPSFEYLGLSSLVPGPVRRSEAGVIENPQQDEKSRSQVKRDFRELKNLGIRLAGLSSAQLRALPLSEKTLEAALASHGMARNALQRHYRHLSSLLSEEDVAAIRAALAGTLQPHAEDVAKLHEAEQWRDKLLSADETQLAAFVERYPECDRTHVRLLVRNARKELEIDKPPKSARQLFRYLRGLIDPQV